MSNSDQPAPHTPNGESETSVLMAFLHQHGKVVKLAPDEVLFREQLPCTGTFFVEEGAVELTITSGGRKLHVGSAHPGQLLGIASVLAKSENQSTATAMLPSKVIFVEASDIRDYLKQHPEICLHTVQLLGAEILDMSSNTIRPMKLQPRYPKLHD